MPFPELASIFSDVRIRTRPCTPVEWAEAKRSLSAAVSSRAGRVSYDFSPYLREIVNNFDPRSPVNMVVVVKGAQLGLSQLVLETIMGYTIDVYPRSMLFVSADKATAEENMAVRVDSMLYETGLQDRIRPSSGKKTRSTGDTSNRKEFAGGVLYARSAQSANKMRNISAGVLLFDELDAAKQNVGRQGSPIHLAESRTASFERTRKLYFVSTPTTDRDSNIYPAYLRGDRRKWEIPCPHCGEYQQLLWDGKASFHDDIETLKASNKSNAGIKFELDTNGILIPSSVYYECVNGCRIDETAKYFMNLKGRWTATAKTTKRGLVSYHLSSLPSNFSSWTIIVQEFLDAKKDKNALQVWVNNRLGEIWVEQPKSVDVTKLNENIANYKPGIVPNLVALDRGNSKICLLICSVDVNGSRDPKSTTGWLAVEVKGYCSNGVSYSIAKAEIHGSLEQGEGCWVALDTIMNHTFLSDDDDKDGNPTGFKIQAMFIDTGNKTNVVYNFTEKCSKHPRTFGIKGVGKGKSYKFRLQTQNKSDAKVYNVNVNLYKDNLVDYLTQKGKVHSQPDYYFNFPNDQDNTGFEGLGLESFGVTLVGGGYNKKYFSTYRSEFKKEEVNPYTGEVLPIGDWVKRSGGAYTHFWDCAVYNLAGLDIMCNILAEWADLKGATTQSILSHLSIYYEEYGVPFYEE